MNALWKGLSAAAAIAVLAGCASRPFIAPTPPDFVDLGDKYANFEYRATTDAGVVLAVRAFDNDPKGPLSFWWRSVERRMRENGGYALIEKKAVQAGALTGQSLRFGHDEGKVPYLYDLTLFVTDQKVFVLEAGGPKAEVLGKQPQLDWFVRNFRTK